MTPEVVDIFDIGYDSKTKSITFPVRDKQGRCLFVARRSVVTKFFNYPAGAEKPVYGLYELGDRANYPSEVIICESMIDAIYFWTVGKYAVALNGLGNELQFKQLREMPCRKFILCTDSDDAGMKARARIKKNVRNKLITEYVLPEGRKDANECTPEELLNLKEIF
jgi:DNA primase